MTDGIRPRLRSAAIVWGLVLAALGAGAAWLVLDPQRISAIGLRLLEASPADVAVVIVGALLVVGVVIVVGSVLSVVHRAQDRGHERRLQKGPDPVAPEAVAPGSAAPDPTAPDPTAPPAGPVDR